MVTVIDTETKLIQQGRLAPPLVCMSMAHGDDAELFHHIESREPFELILNSDDLIVGDNVSFDFSVCAAKWPDLLPLIFEVYEANRVTDTEIREKLNHIGMGIYRGFEHNNGEWEKLNYSLEDLARRHLGIQLEKGGWQLRFGELYDVPLSFWPKEAVDYALADVVVTEGIWQRQEQDKRYLADEFRQARAAFWIQLMACWGLKTDPEGVRAFATKIQREYDEIQYELQAAGFVRSNGVRNVKAVQNHVAKVYTELGKKVPLTDGGKKGDKKPQTNADVCERSGDPLLKKYADLSSLKKTLSTDIPLLTKATKLPLEVHFESLLVTSRVGSSPNVQNLPVEIGVRECFAPREGCVYAVADFSGFELRTWAQVCLEVLGFSKLAKYLNEGKDGHCELACRMLNISYDQAVAEYKADPKGRVYFPRQASKSGNFGFPGGLGVDTFIEYARTNYGVVLEPQLAADLRRFWLETWDEAQPYLDWIAAQCNEPVPQIKHLFVGRFRGNVRFTEAANGMFQGLAADAAKAAGWLVAKACYVDQNSPLYGCRIVNFIHDELVVEVPDDEYAHDAAVELARLMVEGASPFLPDVPPIAEPLLTRKWSKSAKPVRDEHGRLVPWDFPKRVAA